MKKVRTAVVLVDAYRRPSRQRNTAGRYKVGAKTEKEAVKLVQKAIGFGSVQFHYWERIPTLKYKEVLKASPRLQRSSSGEWCYEQARHACSPLDR